MDPKPLADAPDQEGSIYQWYCETTEKTTTIWANFHDANPNEATVEINVRRYVFFPEKNHVNYITILR